MKLINRSRDTDTGHEKSHIKRRRFLSGVGATGLTTAAVIFGNPEAAQAVVAWRCCRLCFNPSISLTTCKATSGHYLWYCTAETNIQCQCCESKGTGNCPSGVKSAGGCFYVGGG